MSDFTIPGPWPRRLTQDEIEEIKARAMIKVGEQVERQLPSMTFGLGDAFVTTYTVSCGTRDEIKEAKKHECGAVYASNLPACKLDKGHPCAHSSVIRWG